MGLYDTILIPCPECGEKYPSQSKSGDCAMDVYEIDEAPEEVMQDVNRHAPFICDNCGCKFSVKLNLTYEVIREVNERGNDK